VKVLADFFLCVFGTIKEPLKRCLYRKAVSRDYCLLLLKLIGR
jgi:hypothetical protein